eukprot:tig00020912_g15798.t1
MFFAVSSSPQLVGQRSGFLGRAAPSVRDVNASICTFSISAEAGAVETEKLGKDTRNKSYYPSGDDVAAANKKWYVIDAADQRLGRLSVQIADILRGKHKPTYTPAADTGDYVVVVNAEKVAVTGNKESEKLYRRHSGRPGGMKTEQLKDVRSRIPERIIETAVKGMLPKNTLGRQIFTHLKVVAGPEHPFAAQKPEELSISTAPRRPTRDY